MKLLQINIWASRLEKNLVNLIKEVDADIVCLQEAVDYKGFGFFFASLDDIKEACGYKHSFHSPAASFNLFKDRAHFGNAILSKHEFSKTETIFTNLEYVSDFDFENYDYNVRNLQYAKLGLAKDEVLHILNHHGHHVPSHKNGNEDTMRQMEQIADFIKTLDGSIILTGDFNLVPESKSIGLINSQLRNLSVENKLTTTRNIFTPKNEVCDYIFVNEKIKVKKFQALDDIVSDHQALLLEFDINSA